MRPLKEWFNSKMERLKNRNLHFRQEHVAPIYSFYLLMKAQFSDYHIMNWDEMFYEFYKENYTDVGNKKETSDEVKEELTNSKIEEELKTESVNEKLVGSNSENSNDSESEQPINTEKRRRKR